MACDCANMPCSCKISAGGGILLTGSGTPRDSYFLEVDPDDVADATNLPNIPLPADIGLLSWNAPITDDAHRNSEQSVSIYLPPAQLILVAQFIRQPSVCSGMVAYFGIPGIGLVTGQNFLGLYNAAGDRVAVTGDLTAQWSGPGTGATKFPWIAPALLSPGRYWVGWVSNATGQTPAFNCVGAFLYTVPNPYNFLAAALYPTALNPAGVTAMPTTFSPAANVMSQYPYWSGLYA